MTARHESESAAPRSASSLESGEARRELELVGILLPLFDGRALEIKELTSLTPALARCLAGHTAELALTGLRALDPESAEELCRHQLLRLNFRHMNLTDELIEKLAEHEGILWIDGLDTLSSARADRLSSHDKSDKSPHNGPVFVAEKTKIEKGAEQRLRKRASQSPILDKGLDLAGARLRVRCMTNTLAEALVFFRKGRLVLDALESLSPNHAALLAGGSGSLSLNGLTRISPKVAAKLAGSITDQAGSETSHKDKIKTRKLSLNGLLHLDSAVARELAVYRGILELNGLATLNINSAKCLRNFDGEIHLKGLKVLDDKTIRVLSPRKHLFRLSPQLEKKLGK